MKKPYKKIESLPKKHMDEKEDKKLIKKEIKKQVKKVAIK